MPWYASYADARGDAWLTPLEDQQLAGLVMWVPCGAVFTAAGLALFAAWLRASDGAAAVDPADRPRRG